MSAYIGEFVIQVPEQVNGFICSGMHFLGRLPQSKRPTNAGIVTEGAPSMKADQDQPEQLEQATQTPSESNSQKPELIGSLVDTGEPLSDKKSPRIMFALKLRIRKANWLIRRTISRLLHKL